MLDSENSSVENKPSLVKRAVRLTGQKKSRRRKISLAVLLVIVLVSGYFLFIKDRNKNDSTASTNPIVASYEKQLPALANAVKNDKGNGKAHYDYAVALYATGDVAKAKEQYEESAKLSPNDALLQNNLGNVYRDLGDYKKAVESYQNAIRLDAKATNPYINLANLYLYTLDQKDLAVKTYQDALNSLPDNQDLQVLLGIAYEQSGNKEKAKETFQSVLNKNANNAAAAAGLKRVQ